jgi:hypothetical protein
MIRSRHTGGSAYGAAGSLITMLIWVYYAAQIVLFGAEFYCGDSDRAWISQVPTHYKFHEPAALDRLALLENARTLL